MNVMQHQDIGEDAIHQHYSWHEQFYYFNLFRTLNGPDSTPGRTSNDPIDIDNDAHYTQAHLSSWIREQNAARKNFLNGQPSTLNPNQIKVLDSVNFPWTRDSNERWDNHYQELIAYKEANGHTNVPRGKDGNKLGIWVKNQRAAYFKLQEEANTSGQNINDDGKKKTTAIITSDQIKLLDNLGFQWKIREEHSDVWERHFDELKAYIQEHGTQSNPKEKTHPKLHRWVCKQRYRYKLRAKGAKNSHITNEQISRLNDIGFKWDKVPNLEEKQRKKEESNRRRNEKRREQRRAEKGTAAKTKRNVLESPLLIPKITEEPTPGNDAPLEAAGQMTAAGVDGKVHSV